MKRRLLSSILMLALVISLFTGVAYAQVDTVTVEHLVSQLNEMSNNDEFMDMLDTFHDLSQSGLDGFSNKYSNVMVALDALHEIDLSGDVQTNNNAIFDYFVDLVKDPTVDEDTLANMRNYLSDGDTDSMEDALNARTNTIPSDVTKEMISRGVARLNRVLGGLKAAGNLQKEIINRSSTGQYSKRTTELNQLIDVYIDLYEGNEAGRDDAISAFDSLIVYYNGLGTTDKNDIHSYFNALGLVNQLSAPDETSPPVVEEEEDDFDQIVEDQDTDTASEYLVGEAESAETEEEAEKVLDNTSTLIDTASETLGESQEEAEDQIEKVAETVNLISSTMDKIEDTVIAQEKATTIIQSIASMKTNAEESGAETSALDEAAENLASKVAEKAGTTSATSTKEGTKATADLSNLDLSEQIQKTNSAADNMTSKLQENNIITSKQKIETKVTINVETEEDVEEVDVTVPNLDKAFETVDKVKVSSSVASFELGKDTIETQSDDTHEERINLNAKKLTAEELEEIKSNLSPGQSIPEGAQVINLTASVKRVNRSTGEVESSTPVTKFKQRIKVSVPYTLKEGENPKEVSVFLVQEDGTVKKVGGVYNPVSKQVEFSRSTFSNYYVAALRVAFDDTTDLETMYKDAIEILAGKGLVAGRTTDIYDPDALVTRAEFTVLVARMLELEADPADLPFNDVDNDNAWFRNHLAGAYNAGIINGTSATTFHPQNNITRQEAAAIVVNAARFLGYKDADGSVITTRYQDHAQIAPWAVRSVATVHRDKLAAGMYVGNFMPKEAVTRDETAVLIYNMLFEY